MKMGPDGKVTSNKATKNSNMCFVDAKVARFSTSPYNPWNGMLQREFQVLQTLKHALEINPSNERITRQRVTSSSTRFTCNSSSKYKACSHLGLSWWVQQWFYNNTTEKKQQKDTGNLYTHQFPGYVCMCIYIYVTLCNILVTYNVGYRLVSWASIVRTCSKIIEYLPKGGDLYCEIFFLRSIFFRRSFIHLYTPFFG